MIRHCCNSFEHSTTTAQNNVNIPTGISNPTTTNPPTSVSPKISHPPPAAPPLPNANTVQKPVLAWVDISQDVCICFFLPHF